MVDDEVYWRTYMKLVRYKIKWPAIRYSCSDSAPEGRWQPGRQQCNLQYAPDGTSDQEFSFPIERQKIGKPQEGLGCDVNRLYQSVVG